jgi:thiol-disulfide isomerase/thioredoxin
MWAPVKGFACLILSALASAGCGRESKTRGDVRSEIGLPMAEGGGVRETRRVVLIDAPGSGAVPPIVREAAGAAVREHRTLVVYVGASWCEPCQRFRDAVAKGELDATLSDVALLEFDFDRDHERLATAGYVSKYIPLLALPAPDGSASGKQIEGGVKGEGAVGFIVPRLRAMLAE